MLDCAVLLDHDGLLALPISEHATYGVEHLRHFMASHEDELYAALVHSDRASAELAALKEHMVIHFPKVQTSKMWEALAPEKAHAQWVDWCRVFALLRTCCPTEALCRRCHLVTWEVEQQYVGHRGDTFP